MTVPAPDVLRRVPLFAELDGADLDRLARLMAVRRVPAGSEVTVEGRPGAVLFFVIVSGEATVESGGRRRARLGAGDWFGEMALVEHRPRSATVTAATDLECYALSASEFRGFVEEHPSVSWALLRTLAQRLRAAEARDEGTSELDT